MRLPLLFALTCLLCASLARAETYKCRTGDRVVYQEAPCPAGAAILPMTEAGPDPDVWQVHEAQRRAKSDKDQLRSLELEAKQRALAEQRAATHAKPDKHARKHEKNCIQLLKQIRKAEPKTGSGDETLYPPNSKAAKEAERLARDQARYRGECGPL
jgi:hypothetical protein